MKMNRMAGWIVGVLVVAALVYLVASKQAPNVSNTNTSVIPTPSPNLAGEVTIGGLLPLSGDQSAKGTAIQKAMQMAVEEINAGTGVAGKKLVVTFEDNACAAAQAEQAAARTFTTGTIALFVSDICTTAATSLATAATANKTIILSPSVTSVAIEKPGDDYYFSLALSPDDSRVTATSTGSLARVSEFASKFNKRYGQAPTFLAEQASAYSSLYLVRDVIEKDGADTAKMQKTLSTLADWSGGALTDVTLDKNGDLTAL